MALIVETGSGVPEAESYISVEDALAYLAKFYGSTAFADLSVEEQEVALRKATRDLSLLVEFVGERATQEQELDFPRTTVVGLPKQVKQATAELALLSLDVDPTGALSNSGNVQSEEVHVGGVATKKSYFAAQVAPELASMRKIKLLLGKLINGQSTSIFVKVARG